MSNKLIPFDAATFDPNFQEPYMYIPLRYIGKGGTKKYPLVFESTTSDGWEHSFTKEGVYYLDQAPSLFMEPIEPEGEEIYRIPRSTYNKMADAVVRCNALEKERDELKAQRDRLLRALDKIRKSKNMDCGCSPCTGQCRSAEALELHIEGICEIAADAILDRPTPPATIPFSWEKYKEGYVCQTREGNEIKFPLTFIPDANIIVAPVANHIIQSWNEKGESTDDHETPRDLVLIPPAPVEEVRYGLVDRSFGYNDNRWIGVEPNFPNQTILKLTFRDNICISAEPIKP